MANDGFISSKIDAFSPFSSNLYRFFIFVIDKLLDKT